MRCICALLVVCAVASALPVAQRSGELEAAASNGYGGYGGREVVILEEKNGYGQHGDYGEQYNQYLYGGGGGGYGGGGGGDYGGGYNYGPIIVHIPNSEPYYPGYMPLGGYGYSQPAHTPHYEQSYGY
ncbi:uncharacterized protein LOC129590887 [Paramacrobiotus metropolitanus]|uniref:uncharacterized protein LOC129590887 n=1 Tax=Paramacrobiotus metropolitanus TaxID=2943436 RepID=UPI0024459B9A|nr:uncharacterized protein LOC129590887 [Paramacrobiotus metropolitanus]